MVMVSITQRFDLMLNNEEEDEEAEEFEETETHGSERIARGD